MNTLPLVTCSSCATGGARYEGRIGSTSTSVFDAVAAVGGGRATPAVHAAPMYHVRGCPLHVPPEESGAVTAPSVPVGIRITLPGSGAEDGPGRCVDVTSSHSRIADANQVVELEELLRAAAAGTKKLTPPEIVYVRSSVEMTFHGGGIGALPLSLSLDPRSALGEWAARGTAADVIKVDAAEGWRQTRAAASAAAAAAGRAASPRDAIRTSDELDFDWSFSTPFAGSVFLTPPRCGDGPPPPPPAWRARPASSIDTSLLTDTTAPILYYDQLPLYEDDLHDWGDARLSVRVRVMPRCVFVLQRFVLRVDKVLVRARDVRYFHAFGESELHRDVRWREAKWRDLGGRGLPTNVKEWAETGRADALVGKLPDVDLPKGLPQFSSLRLNGF